MLSLLEQIDQGALWPYSGGIHPLENKHLSNKSNIDRLPLAEEFVIPVPTVGQNCILKFAVGDRVLKGESLTEGNGHLPAHAPTSGTIKAIEPRASNHPSAFSVLSVVLSADGKDEWLESINAPSEELSNEQMLTRIRESGIAGMGGAAFPSHIKLNPISDIELVIINGIECEPYITSDDRLMREHAEDILKGMTYIDALLDPLRFIIAIEDNKPEAAKAMNIALAKFGTLASKARARVTVVPTKYPSGGEKQLIQILTGKEVPSGGIPAQLGIVVHNVGTAMAIGEAIDQRKPLIERVVTITGENVTKPGNYWVPIGTPIEHLLNSAGVRDKSNVKLIVGGPMMGHMQIDLSAPILKGSNCIIAPSISEFTTESNERACIRCGECAVACPAGLLPQQLFWHSKAEEYDKAASYNLKDCIECGCCNYVCPSDIPLVEYYRVAKSAIRKEEQEKIAAEQAKKRFDARLERLEKEKREREEKAKKAAERRKSNMSSGDKGAVAAALARVKAKKSSEGKSPEATSDKQSQVAAAIARAKAKKQAQQPEDTQSEPIETPANDKKAQIAAAVARAKAKKLAKQQTESDESIEPASDSTASQQPVLDKKAKIAAAIAKAKAKKVAQEQESQGSDDSQISEAFSPEEQKKARIAAAVAKAKAKKAQKETNLTDESESNSSQQASEENIAEQASPEELKKAKIAAAVAKAKAKKAQNDNKETVVEESVFIEKKPEIELSAEEQKKARIAAAVAKAKAKKLAREEQ
ncbi:electron transport complex subunit RsxC [Shewanella sp. OPT22]|nr:electron transport complex subunit RsxC [Shewanella sp. OPT22]